MPGTPDAAAGSPIQDARTKIYALRLGRIQLAQERVSVRLLPLISSLLRRYGATPERRQDVASEIVRQITRLTAAHDPVLGVPLEAYLTRTLPEAIFVYSERRWPGGSP